MDKPREIDAKVGTIRPARRDTYDARAATAIPSATGGRPATGTEVAAPLAAAAGEEMVTPIVPLGSMSSLIQQGKLRFATKQQSFLPTVQVPNRTLEEYSLNNTDMVNITAAYLERVAVHNPRVLQGFKDANEAALWAVAHIQRSFEPGSAPRMVDLIHQSRGGRRVYSYLRRIEEALNVES